MASANNVRQHVATKVALSVAAHPPAPAGAAAAPVPPAYAPPSGAAATTQGRNTAAPAPDNHDTFQDDATDRDVPVIAGFDEMPLHQLLLRGIYAYGFEAPSAIQQRAIVPMIQGGDIIAQAQSGTGKTGAFSIGLLQRVDFRRTNQVQALVLSPTHELARQTYEVVSALGGYLADGQPFCEMFVGGTKVQDNLRALQHTLVAVGTPGRVCDLIARGALRCENLKLLVLDEADEMLSQGFLPQILQIFRFLPRDIQVALFSATLPDEVLDMTRKFMRDPTRILVRKESLTLKGIKQFYVALEEDQKLDTLVDLYESASVAQSFIFANTKRKVDYIAAHLNRLNHTVSCVHAEMSRADRERVIQEFREGRTRVLISTDLTARGIDVAHVNMVINYDMPLNKENYLHRIGRSGRYGKKGIAINLVSTADVPVLREIQTHFYTQVDELPMDFANYLGE